MADWNNRFVELSNHIASCSKDKSVKVGAIIADTSNRIVSAGYNGLPSGWDDNILERHDRPLKYLYTEHAERIAIYNATRKGVSTLGCIMYLNWFPCADCVRGIIQSGISKIVCSKPDLSDPRWGISFSAALEMLNECGIEIIYID